MDTLTRQPLIVSALSLFLSWLSARIGLYVRKRQLKEEKDVHQDLDIIVSATLTLLGLIIGFSFSMAISRYDQRKNYEEAEANAIGTEYLRADLLPSADRSNVRALLRNYLDQRILFYETRDDNALSQIDDRCNYGSTADRAVVRRPHSGWRAANACACPSHFRHERCVELAGIYASRVVEPNPTWSTVPDGRRSHLLQRVNRL
jgi:hypothetical protein